MAIELAANQYGKAEVRLVHVDRTDARHRLTDLTVSVALAGDLDASHLTGDNSKVLPTDTQKNTVYAFAREYGVGEIERFGLLLARHFVDSQPTIHRARVGIEQHSWVRIGPHSFQREGGGTRTATVQVDGSGATVLSGLTGLTLLNTTDSEFNGFIQDRYTTLKPTDDRILATSVNARWRHTTPADQSDPYWAESFDGARQAMVDAFVGTYSRALQQTLYAMGEAVLANRSELTEVRLSLPNKHHFLVDLAAFDLDNPDEVYLAADRPYGLIEGTVRRTGTQPVEEALWIS